MENSLSENKTDENSKRIRITPLKLGLFLVALTFAVYCRVLKQDFVCWDDSIHVYANPYVLGFAHKPSLSALAEIWRAPYQGLYIPITYCIYAVLARLGLTQTLCLLPDGGASLLDPRVFHGANLIVHIVNVLLLFALLRKIGVKDLPACFGASLFAVHPIQAEAVGWISELRGLLAACFGMSSILFYLEFAKALKSKNLRWRSIVFGVFSVLFLILATLCKPSAISIAAIAFLLGYFSIGLDLKRSFAILVVFAGVCIPIVFVTNHAQPLQGQYVAPLWIRPFVAGDAVAFYFGKLIVPLHFCIDYSRSPQRLMMSGWGYVTWIVTVALGYFAYRYRKKSPNFALGFAIFIIGLAPVLGLVPFAFQSYSTVADRYCYISMIGAALMISEIVSGFNLRGAIVCGGLLTALASLCAGQIRIWDNADSLFKQAILCSPSSSQMHHDFAITLMVHGHVDAAKSEFIEALRLNPHNGFSEVGLGQIAESKGDLKEAERMFRLAVRDNPRTSATHSQLGILYASQRRDVEAVAELDDAVKYDDGWVARAHAALSDLLARHGQTQNAIKEARLALKYAPLDPAANERLKALSAS